MLGSEERRHRQLYRETWEVVISSKLNTVEVLRIRRAGRHQLHRSYGIAIRELPTAGKVEQRLRQ